MKKTTNKKQGTTNKIVSQDVKQKKALSLEKVKEHESNLKTLEKELKTIFNKEFTFMPQPQKRRLIIKKGNKRVAIIYLNKKVLCHDYMIELFKNSQVKKLEMLKDETVKNKDSALQFYYNKVNDLKPLTSF